jgi:hypothetical protein
MPHTGGLELLEREPSLPVRGRVVRLDAAEEDPLREALSTFTEIGASAVGPAHPAAAARARRPVHPGRPQIRDPGRFP